MFAIKVAYLQCPCMLFLYIYKLTEKMMMFIIVLTSVPPISDVLYRTEEGQNWLVFRLSVKSFPISFIIYYPTGGLRFSFRRLYINKI